ncbi:MAG: hypothetical protein IPN86_13065 [Saprospiraceae bacterium]|nr:hypothetical protein [Saprospiraceae bacterium]
MKHLVITSIFLFVAFYSFAQKNISFIKQEIKNLEIKLIKKGENLQLNNQQLAQLTNLFEDKGQRITNITGKNSGKDAISIALLKLDEEFIPRVNAILTKDQRLALQSFDVKK